MKKKRADPTLHCEGDTEPGESYYNSDGSDDVIVSLWLNRNLDLEVYALSLQRF